LVAAYLTLKKKPMQARPRDGHFEQLLSDSRAVAACVNST